MIRSRAILVALVWGAALLLWLLLRLVAPRPAPDPVVEIREVDSPALLARITDLELEANGLRARLRGVERRAPEVIYRGTDPVTVPETVFVALAVDRKGVVSVGRMVEVGAVEGAVQARPELLAGIRASDCDDGLSYGAGGLVCDRARAGHLALVAGASAGWRMEPRWPPLRDEERVPAIVGEAGLSWTPSYRSPLRIDLTAGTDQRVRIRMQTGLRLF